MASSQNRNKRKQLAHIPAALTILLHAFERYAMDHSTYIFFLVAGLCFLCLVLFHKPIEKKLPWVDGAFFMIEGVLSTIVFFEFLHEGKKMIPFVYLAVALFQFFMAWWFSRKAMRTHRENTH